MIPKDIKQQHEYSRTSMQGHYYTLNFFVRQDATDEWQGTTWIKYVTGSQQIAKVRDSLQDRRYAR